jgi:hypothetical protein
MKGIIIGTVIGFVIATVGFTGAVNLLDQGVDTVSKHAPVIQEKIDELKNYTEQLSR